MIKRRGIGALTALLMTAVVLLTAVGWLFPSAFASVSQRTEPAYVSAMNKDAVMDIQIIVDDGDWAQMLKNAAAEEYIPVTLVINGKRIENVGLRPKGNSSLSMVAQDDTTDRYSFKIEFDHYIKGQTWMGLDKMVINNMHGDATYLKEYFSYDLMEYIGVDVPLCAFSNITVNGQAWGFYIAVEALEDSYAQRVYGSDHGKLYKPESMGMGGRGDGRMNEFMQQIEDFGGFGGMPGQGGEDFRGQRENQMPAVGSGEVPGGVGNMGGINGFGVGSSGGASLEYTDDEISSYSAIFDNAVFDSNDSDFRRVIEALEKLNAAEDIESVVDVEATLRYFAAHTVIVNMDSYVSSMCHNYYLYENNGQLTILPWDFNLAFGGFEASGASEVVNLPIDTPVSGVSLQERPILGKLLQVPEYLELYHGYLNEIVDGYFESGIFEEKIGRISGMISPYVERDPSAFYDFPSFQNAVEELRNLGLLRAQSVKGQLEGSIPSTSAGQAADLSALIDASSISLSALGSMGGGSFGGEGRQALGREGTGDASAFPGGQGLDMEKMQRAMEIIKSSGGEVLTEEQLQSLKELGLSDEEIEMISNMGQGGPGGGFGGAGGFPGGEAPVPGQTMENQGAGSSQSAGENPSTALGQTMWVMVGCGLLLIAGLLFVIFYKRRGA